MIKPLHWNALIFWLNVGGRGVNAVQPDNLLYASNDPDSPDYNTIKIADFGLAKFLTENSTMETTCGTVRAKFLPCVYPQDVYMVIGHIASFKSLMKSSCGAV